MPIKRGSRGRRKSNVPTKRTKIELQEIVDVETEVIDSNEQVIQSSSSVNISPSTPIMTYPDGFSVLPLNGSSIVQILKVPERRTTVICSNVSFNPAPSVSTIPSTNNSTPLLHLKLPSNNNQLQSDNQCNTLSVSNNSSDIIKSPQNITNTTMLTEPDVPGTSSVLCASQNVIKPSSLNQPSSLCVEAVSETVQEVKTNEDNKSEVKLSLPGPSEDGDTKASCCEDKLSEPTGDECPVCLQTCVHPAKLPCSHVFCYLCLKGIARSGQSCPMCRAPIPFHYADQPELACQPEASSSSNEDSEEKFCWFYEGRNGGWWQFEQRMSDEIEENKNSGASRFEIMICGSLYIIDTMSCVQYPKNCPMRVRRLLRDLPSRVNRKGVAGIYGIPSGKSTGKNV